MPEQTPGHILRTLDPDAQGWVVTEYGGTSVCTWRYASVLRMAGHPYDGLEFGQFANCLRLINIWINHQVLPPPYIWPVPPRQG